MTQLATLLQPAQDHYLNCIRCGLCLSVCPTYREYLSETTSPRGRVALTRKGLKGELELSPNLIKQMYSCFACMACNESCPVGIRPADLALDMRQLQEESHPTGWKQTLFGEVLPKPNRMECATLPLRLYEMLGLRHIVHALGLGKLLPAQLRDIEAMLPRLPHRPLRRILPEVTQANRTGKHRVGFFLGCAQSLLFAEESAATLRVLRRNECMVITPRETICCGMPARGYGRIDLVLAQAKHNIALFEQANVEFIVTDCATCGSTLKEYGQLLAHDSAWAMRANEFSQKVRDVSEFLVEIPLEKPRGRIEARVTYHDPCHLRRGQAIWKQPRELLRMIDGLEFVELPEADWCCGSAGSQLITHYETSTRVLDRKVENVKDTQAQYVASGCPGCQLQLNVGMHRSGLAVKVVHPVQLLDQAYREAGE